MKISSLNLEAFYETARLESFSRAANSLSITQSALSQRVQKLELELETVLIIREPSGLKLTAAGEILLRHCQATESLEVDVLSLLRTSASGLAGAARIAAYSSVLRSVIIPSLAPMLRAHPQVQSDFSTHEMNELENILRSGKADFVVLDHRLGRKGISEMLLGKEEYVVIESAKGTSVPDVYLDHDQADTATELFFAAQPKALKSWRKSFMGDVYGIIDGVEMGLGRAVMSRHLIGDNSRIREVKGYRPHFREVCVHFFEQPYYSKLHQEILKTLQSKAKRYLV